MKSTAAILTTLGLVQAASASVVLFGDNFDRTGSRNIDATLTGITNNTGTALAADAVYSQPWLDPNNKAPTYGTQDGNAANGGGSQTTGSALQLAVGAGTSNAYINHNFTNASILDVGWFSVTVDITGYTQTTVNQGAGFGIGMSAAEAGSMRDAVGNSNNEAHMCNAFGATFPGQTNALADFWFAIRGNNTVAWGSGDTILNSASVAAKTGTLSAIFTVPDFTSGTDVGYEVFYGATSMGTGTFKWSGTGENFIALDARDSTAAGFDNLVIAIPEPGVALFGLLGLAGLVRRRR